MAFFAQSSGISWSISFVYINKSEKITTKQENTTFIFSHP